MLLLFETWLVYPGSSVAPLVLDAEPLGLQEVHFESADGTPLHGYYTAPAQPSAYLLYCHGNGETSAHLHQRLIELRDAHGVAVFAFDYRGYGRSGGKPAEAGILDDGAAAQQWLADQAGIELSDTVLLGRSLGGGVAMQLAARHGCRGLILERTFGRLVDVAAYHYPWLPVRQLMRNRFDSLAVAAAYRGPVLQSHGDRDQVVPYRHGKQLFEAMGSAPAQKRFIEMPGLGHNDPAPPRYEDELRRFLASLSPNAHDN